MLLSLLAKAGVTEARNRTPAAPAPAAWAPRPGLPPAPAPWPGPGAPRIPA